MRNGNRYVKTAAAATVAMTAVLCAGCTGSHAELVTVTREPYEKTGYQTVEVRRGDLQPEFTLTLRADGITQISYDAVNSDLQLDTVYVSVGDKVRKGDLLVSFRSDSIQEKIAEYREQCEQMELLADHYTRLMEIDSDPDYSDDIAMLNEDIAIAKLYIEEAQAKLADYQIVAEDAGTISAMDQYLKDGHFVPGKKLITQVRGNGRYSAVLPENGTLTVGDIYTAELNAMTYEMRVVEVTEKEAVFEPVADMSAVSDADSLTVVVQKPLLSDVVYVEAKAVYEGNAGEFVYLLEEDGYRNAVSVTVGDKVDGYYVITDGLVGGEKVTLE